MEEKFVIDNGSCQISEKSCRRNSHHMLPVMDWMSDVPNAADGSDLIEVQFKNTHKGYYKNSNNIPLKKGDIVTVENKEITLLNDIPAGHKFSLKDILIGVLICPF